MDLTEPSWDWYRTFLAVVREGNLSAAARSIGVTQPTAGRHIEALEVATGTPLFLRSPKGLVPTNAAHELLPLAEAMATAAATMGRTSQSEAKNEGGVVRLAAGELIGQDVLPDILMPFCKRYPGIVIELKLSNRNADLLRGDADIAVRMVKPTQHALVSRRIGALEIGLYAHRRYVDIFGVPQTLEDARRHRLIGFDSDQWRISSGQGGPPQPNRAQFGFRCDNAAAQAAAIRAAIGIGALHVNVASREPDLVRVLEDTMTYKREMWLVMHEGARKTRRVRLLFEHLAEGLTAFARTPK